MLDLGRANGTTPDWPWTSRGCRVVGVDLSSVRIGSAREALQDQTEDIQAPLAFETAPATRQIVESLDRRERDRWLFLCQK